MMVSLWYSKVDWYIGIIIDPVASDIWCGFVLPDSFLRIQVEDTRACLELYKRVETEGARNQVRKCLANLNETTEGCTLNHIQYKNIWGGEGMVQLVEFLSLAWGLDFNCQNT